MKNRSLLIGSAVILLIVVIGLIVKELGPEREEQQFSEERKDGWKSRISREDGRGGGGKRRGKLESFGIEGIPDWVRETGDYYKDHLGDLTEPLNEDELKDLAENPKKDRFRLKVLICRAGAEKNANFNYLLKQEGLRDDPWIDIALAGYDYSVNGNEAALDYILDTHAKEVPGSDVDSVLVLSFVDEWERSIPAVLKHFEGGSDGAAGVGYRSFWMRRKFLFPHNFQRLIR